MEKKKNNEGMININKKIKLLTDGYFHIDKGFLVYGKYHGIDYKAALKPMLIITDTEKIIVDTGIGELPERHKSYYRPERTKTLIESLREEKIKPEEITIVINTHLHVDHCGNNILFKNAKIYVQKVEIDYAYNPDRFLRGGYLKKFFENADFIKLKGDTEIVDGVNVITTPGHTPGHQSIIVNFNDKKYVYCGDTAPLRENIRKRYVVGIHHNPIQALESIDKIRNIDGEYIYAHDIEQLSI